MKKEGLPLPPGNIANQLALRETGALTLRLRAPGAYAYAG